MGATQDLSRLVMIKTRRTFLAPLAIHTSVSLLELRDRKSTRLNSSHSQISYAVFCLKKKKEPERLPPRAGPARTPFSSPLGRILQLPLSSLRGAYVVRVAAPARGQPYPPSRFLHTPD